MFSPSVQLSGSYNFNPSGGEIILTAFDRIQIRPTEITAAHMQRAVMEMNLALVKFNNLQPNLWTVDLPSFPLRAGSPATDRYLYQISRSEYAAISVKTTQGFPSQFWFDRLISPTVTFYLTPDAAYSYEFFYYRVRQIQDATITNGANIEVIYRFLDALTAAAAHRLA